MKPEVIDCGNGCKVCDGYGVMTLYGGPGNEMFAPCLECSPTEPLSVLMKRRKSAEKAHLRAQEKRLIDDHNRRLNDAGLT